MNWYDYWARFYDPALGHFTTQDPLAEKFTFQSPYVYADNNPIRFIDFMGMNADDFKFDANGKLVDYDVNDKPDEVLVLKPQSSPSSLHDGTGYTYQKVDMTPEEIESNMDENGYKKVVKDVKTLETTVKQK